MLNKLSEIFYVFLRLGLTSFGGPIAHLGYFHNEFVKKRNWFDDQSYADIVALCQFLPGPASSQVGIAIGLSRAGIFGAIAAWFAFTLPSALILYTFAIGVSSFSESFSNSWLHGLKVVAVAVIAQALWQMRVKLCPDTKRIIIAILGAMVALFFATPLGQIAVIIMGGALGLLFVKEISELPDLPLKIGIGIRAGMLSLILLVGLLVVLPVLAAESSSHWLELFDRFFRAGSLVFGGGHVVLPLLKAEVVNPGWVSSESFMAGYGAAQAVPGPLFTFTAYLGAVSKIPPNGALGAVVCLLAAFLPSFLLVFGVLPFWEKLRRNRSMRSAMYGINAAVVGLLLSAFYSPVWTSAIFSIKDFTLAGLCFLLLAVWQVPSWGVVMFGAIIGGLFF